MDGINTTLPHLYWSLGSLIGKHVRHKIGQKIILVPGDGCVILGQSVNLSGPVTPEFQNQDTKTVLAL